LSELLLFNYTILTETNILLLYFFILATEAVEADWFFLSILWCLWQFMKLSLASLLLISLTFV